jgi:hypothetical protein
MTVHINKDTPNRSRQFFTIILTFIVTISFLASLGTSVHATEASTGGYKVYLPIVLKPNTTMMLGVYPENWWTPMPQDAINQEYIPLDTWSGKKLSIAGVFHYLDQPNIVNMMLAPIWDSGYTPFVNLYANTTAANIASGGWDQTIHAWAKNFAIYANGGTRMAFLAPLQEMNWKGNPYSLDPTNYIKAFKRIQSIFKQENVPAQSVRWVFAPNGYSAPGNPPFESYYPGDAYVDVVAFSSYNFGTYPTNPYPDWQPPSEIFPPYIQRMMTMAPTKPIFIAQTATTAYGGSKDQWLQDAYNLLAGYSQVKAVIYYNANVDYDWAFYLPSAGIAYNGYKIGVANPVYRYVSPSEVRTLIPISSSP